MDALKVKSMTISELAKIMGTMISCFCIWPLGQTHYQSLECLKVAALKTNHFDWEAHTSLSHTALYDLQWWLWVLPRTWAPISHPNPSLTLFTDLSSYAWGCPQWICGQ